VKPAIIAATSEPLPVKLGEGVRIITDTNRHQRRSSPVIHRRKFMQGRMTAEEVHARLAFPIHAKCAGCGRRPTIRAIVLCPLAEMRARDPDFDTVADLALVNPEAAEKFHGMCVQIKGSDGKPETYVRISTAYCCKTCGPTMERTLAKGPSWCIVEINRGPGTDRIITSG
jgi:hypothetical protein